MPISRTGGGFGPPAVPVVSQWPLSVSGNGRYLQRANGTPFLINGDTPWQLVGNCTNDQIDTYLANRAAKKFNAVLVEAPTAYFATQTPLYNNVDGVAPFTSTSYTAASFESLNNTYWQRVDYMVNAAKALDIVVLFCFAYLGFGGGVGNSGDQGWDYQVDAASDANLQAYGSTLATRYTQGNIIWVAGGDYSAPNVAKCWNIVTGIRSVNPNALVTYHGGRGDSGYSVASGQTGFNVNNTYTGISGTEYDYCATEYARSPAMPFFHIEGWYEGDGNLTDTGYRRQAYATMLSGGCGHMLGVSELWGLGGYGASTTAAQALANHLNTTVANDMTHFFDLFSAYSWQLLEPKTDTSLITTSLGSGANRIIGARASDGSFAMVWTPTQNFTVAMSALTPSSVRGRWFNPTDGTFAAASGSPYANTGTQAFTAPGERVLVLDAA